MTKNKGLAKQEKNQREHVQESKKAEESNHTITEPSQTNRQVPF